jgi:eukaryotic-like serine/threonine-protein kinase
MSSQRQCERCGQPLSGAASDNICPRCLAQLGQATWLGESATEATEATADEPQGQPPTRQPVHSDTLRIRYFGDYELIEEIARGGMGTVYRARQASLNRPVALKLISAGALATPELVKRFHAEAELAASLTHPNIVPIHEIGQHDGQHYFSMGLVEGPSLRKHLNGHPMPTREAAALMATVARAVHYAHQRGVLHRDLKPSNIVLDRDGTPHLTDFGLAKLVEGQSTLTHTNAVLGTPSYMAPEQARGATKEVTTAADVYGLGAVLYEALTGHPPFAGGTSVETIRQVLDQEPRRPSLWNTAVDRDLETICLKCIEKEPERRYASANALANDLDRWSRSEPIMAHPATLATHLSKWMRRNPTVASLLALLLALFVAGILGILAQWQRAETHRAVAEKRGAILRQNLYSADIYLAQNAIRDGNYGLARQTLLAHVPAPGEPDLRGFEWGYYLRLCDGDKLAAWPAHSNVVKSIAVSPDGRLVVSAAKDNLAKVWDALSHRLLLTIPDSETAIFSHDAELLVTVGVDGLVQIWNTHTLTQVISFDTGSPADADARVALSPNRRILAVSVDGNLFGGGSVRLFDLSSEEPTLVGTLPDSGNRMAFTSDGELLVTASAERIQLWEVESWMPIRAFQPLGRGGVSSIAISPDNRLIATTEFWHHTIRLIDFETGQTVTVLRGHTAMVWTAVFSPDGSYLASGSSDQTIRLWDVASHAPRDRMVGHESEIWSLAFSPSGETLWSGSKDETVAVWPGRPAPRHSRIPTAHRPVNPPILSPDGKLMAAPAPDGDLDLWVLNGEPVQEKLHGEKIALRFSTDGTTLLTLSTEDTLHLRDLSKHALRSVTRLDPPPPSPIFRAVVSDDGQLLATTGESEPVIQVWEIASGRLVRSLESGIHVGRLAFSPERRYIATFTGWEVEVHDLEEANPRITLEGHKDGLSAIAFSPDNTVLASASVDNTVRLWSVGDWRELATLRGHREGVLGVAFSSDNRTLATASADNSIKLWNWPTLREIAWIRHTAPIVHAGFSLDNRLLIYICDHNHIIVLDGMSRAERDVFNVGIERTAFGTRVTP